MTSVSNRRFQRRPAGFTLIELAVVLAIAGLLVATVTVGIKHLLPSARLEWTAERIILLEEQARSHARRFAQPAELIIDLDRGVWEVNGSHGRSLLTTLSVGGGLRIDRVLLPGRRVEHGQLRLLISADGRSETYAVRLAGRDLERWLFFTGTTGQEVRMEDERQLENLFAALAERAHAP